MVHVLLLAVCAVAIYLSCEWFVNAVEWLGRRLNMGSTAVGTILAALGTALPESVVTLVAVTFGGKEHGADIGVGAAMGGPLVVGTVAYATVGASLLLRQRLTRRAALVTSPPAHGSSPTTGDAESGDAESGDLELGDGQRRGRSAVSLGFDTSRLVRDQTWFLAIFVVKVGLGLVAFAIKPWLGVVFFAAYAAYFWKELRGESVQDDEELEPLKLQPRRETPSTTAVVAQTAITLTIIFFASQLFVHQLEWAGPALGLPPVVVALLLSPVATELPEIMNALIWVNRGKTQLALANISGSMMIQATVPSGLGLLFTPWHFTAPLLLAGIITAAAVVYLLVLLKLNRLTPVLLTATAGFYSVFAVVLVSIGLLSS
jgi:cation:H+ antiporter